MDHKPPSGGLARLHILDLALHSSSGVRAEPRNDRLHTVPTVHDFSVPHTLLAPTTLVFPSGFLLSSPDTLTVGQILALVDPCFERCCLRGVASSPHAANRRFLTHCRWRATLRQLVCRCLGLWQWLLGFQLRNFKP